MDDPILSLFLSTCSTLKSRKWLLVAYLYLYLVAYLLISWHISGQFCLTELGHGLDALHLETTATLLPDGCFDLHTPLERAAK
jgi:hypothetical protein